jgi:hypothetical protein
MGTKGLKREEEAISQAMFEIPGNKKVKKQIPLLTTRRNKAIIP